MTEIELKIVNALGLDPSRVYLIEVDCTKVSAEITRIIPKALGKLGIRGLVIRTHGGDGIRAAEQPPMEPAND